MMSRHLAMIYSAFQVWIRDLKLTEIVSYRKLLQSSLVYELFGTVLILSMLHKYHEVWMELLDAQATPTIT